MRGPLGRTPLHIRLFCVCCLCAVLLEAALAKRAEARQQAPGTTCCPVVASKASSTVDDIPQTSLVVWVLPGCSLLLKSCQGLGVTSAPPNLVQKETVETSFRIGDEPSRGGGRGRGRGEGECCRGALLLVSAASVNNSSGWLEGI